MKKIFLLLFFIFAVIGCQQKEDTKPAYQFPAGPIQTGPIQMQDDARMLKDAVEKDPGNVNAWIKLGNIMMDASRFNEAIEAYQKALKLDPKNVDVRVDIGTCYKNIGKPGIAVKEYRKALEYNPNHLYGHKNLGVVLAFDLNDRVQAIKEFERYLELAPNAPDAAQVRQEIEKLKAAR